MKNKKKILTLLMVFVLLLMLTGCSGKRMTMPISFDNANFFDYILVIPVAWIMQLFSGLTGNNFGFGIIITTIIIRTIAWPIYAKSNDLSLKMSIAQPEIARLQAKYAGRDDMESKQRMQMEMQQIYKKHNINLLGCFLPFLQMPIFIAVYQVVQRIHLAGGKWTDKVANKNFLGIDLDGKGNFLFWKEKGSWVGLVLALIVGVTMFLLNWLATKKQSYQKQTGSHGVQSDEAMQSQKMMKYMQIFMVIMMVTFSINSNSLAFYWIVGNIYSIGQNLVNRKISEKKYYKLRNKDLVVTNYDKKN